MKYAIVEISGKQFWVETGKFYDFNRIPTELGKEITLNRVLLINNEGNVLIGQPYLENVKIQGKILTYKKDGRTYRQYDNILTDSFINLEISLVA